MARTSRSMLFHERFLGCIMMTFSSISEYRRSTTLPNRHLRPKGVSQPNRKQDPSSVELMRHWGTGLPGEEPPPQRRMLCGSEESQTILYTCSDDRVKISCRSPQFRIIWCIIARVTAIRGRQIQQSSNLLNIGDSSNQCIASACATGWLWICQKWKLPNALFMQDFTGTILAS